MNLIRHLATRPAAYSLPQLQAEAGAVAVNVVGDQLAGYWNDGDEPTQQEWEAIVAAHAPALPVDPLLTATDPRDTTTIRRT